MIGNKYSLVEYSSDFFHFFILKYLEELFVNKVFVDVENGGVIKI